MSNDLQHSLEQMLLNNARIPPSKAHDLAMGMMVFIDVARPQIEPDADCPGPANADRLAPATAVRRPQPAGTAKRLRDLAAGELTGEIKQFEYSLAADRIQDLEGLLEQANARLTAVSQAPEPASRAPTERMNIDQSRKYLVEFMNAYFTDTTFTRYIMADPVDQSRLAGDFACQMANALRQIELHAAAPESWLTESGLNKREQFEAWAKREGHKNFARMAGDNDQYDDYVLRAQYRCFSTMSPPAAPVPSQAKVDLHLDAVLGASGSALRNYSMEKTLADMRSAMRSAMAAASQAELDHDDQAAGMVLLGTQWLEQNAPIKAGEGLRKLAAYPLEEFAIEGKPDDYKLFGVNDWKLTVGDIRSARRDTALPASSVTSVTSAAVGEEDDEGEQSGAPQP